MKRENNPVTPCPDPRVWDQLASGLLRGDDAWRAAEHASMCPTCARALRESVAIFASVEELDDEVFLPRVVEFPVPTKKPVPSVAWRWAAAAAVLLVSLSGVLVWRNSRSDALASFQRAYKADRFTRMRLDGVDYAPLRQQMGAASADLPVDYAQAESMVALEPNDAKSRLTASKLSALRGDVEKTSDPIDRAVALYIANKQEDALTALTELLRTEPNNATALFDRIVVAAALGRANDARADYARLLAVEPSSPWTAEAAALLASPK